MERGSKPPASRQKPEGSKFDFSLQFYASKVPPVGWDKPVISLISVQTGKIRVRTSRGHVRNGMCEWPDPVIETTKLIQDLSTRTYDKKLYKLVVQTGSLRMGILGETTINISDFVNGDLPTTVTLPLKNCSSGTVLHVKIQCLTLKGRLRYVEGQRSISSELEGSGFLSEDDGSSSDSMTVRSVDSSSSGQSFLQNPNGQVRDGRPSKATSCHSSGSFDSLSYANELDKGDDKGCSTAPGQHAKKQAGGLQHPSVGSKDSPPKGQSEQEIEDLKYLVKKLQEEANYEKGIVEDLRVQLHTMEEANANFACSIVELEESLKQRDSEVQRLTETNETLDKQLHKLKDSNAGLTDTVKELERELLALNRKFSNSTTVIDEVHAKCSEDDEEAKSRQEELEWQERANVAEIQFMQKLAAEVEEEKVLKVHMKDFKIEDSVWNQKVSAMQNKEGMAPSKDVRGRVEGYEHKLIALERENIDCKERLMQLTILNERYEDMVGELQNKMDNMEKQMQDPSREIWAEEVEKLEAQLTEYEKKSALLQGRIQELLQERTLNKSHIEELASQLLMLSEEIKLLHASNDEYHLVASKLESEKSQMQVKLVEAQDEINVHRETSGELVAQMADLKAQLDSQLAANQSLQRRALELDIHLKGLEKLNVQLNERNAHHQEQLRCVTEENDCHRQEVESAQACNMEHQTTIRRLEATLQEMMNKHQLQLSEIEKQHAVSLGEAFELKQKIEQELDKRSALEQKLQNALNDCAELEITCSNLETQVESLISERDDLKLCASKMCGDKDNLAEEVMHMQEKMREMEEGFSITKRSWDLKIADLEDHMAQGESLLEAQHAKQHDELTRLRTQMRQAQHTLAEQEEEKNEGHRRAKALEEEILGLQEILRRREEDSKVKDEGLAKAKKRFMEIEADLLQKVEDLELKIEQLVSGTADDTGMDQLKNELLRLQSQNSFLSRKEQELQSRMRTEEVLHEEIQRLEDANYLLEAHISKFMETAKNPFLLEKIMGLETELAEAVEANNIYKLQLKSFFEKQPSMENLDLDQIIDGLYQYKKKATELQEELHDMHERYSLISLQLAEAEAQRGELVILMKNLKGKRT